MNCCKVHFEADMTWDERKAAHDACPDCLEQERLRWEKIQRDCTIDPARPYGEHIALTCVNHPDLRWSTKNIDFIGARSIFYSTREVAECACPGGDLVVVP